MRLSIEEDERLARLIAERAKEEIYEKTRGIDEESPEYQEIVNRVLLKHLREVERAKGYFLERLYALLDEIV